MTPTERAKRSDALYYETVSVNRRVLCDMVANREADLEDAKAESEHMRLKALAVMGELEEENERLKAENDRLRELLHRLLVEYRYLRVRPRKTYLQHEGRMRAIEEEMRELGVEVDA